MSTINLRSHFTYLIELAADTAIHMGKNLVGNTKRIANFFLEGYNNTVEQFPEEANQGINCETWGQIYDGNHMITPQLAVAGVVAATIHTVLFERVVKTFKNPTEATQ